MDWEKLLSDTDLAGYRTGRHSRRIGFGYKPAVILVDMINLYASPRFSLEYEDNIEDVIQANIKLLAAIRHKNVPVIYSNVGLYSTVAENGILGEKVTGVKDVTLEAVQVVDELAPQEGDVVITKPKASAFFATQLASMLFYLGVDTIIVTGLTTSGCVRATVVDGFSYNFRVIVPVECVGDHELLLHKVSLFDMDMKYGDVVELQEVLIYLGQLGQVLFPFT